MFLIRRANFSFVMTFIIISTIKPRKNLIFLKNGKTIISVGNWKFSRSQMMKRTSPLNLSCEI